MDKKKAFGLILVETHAKFKTHAIEKKRNCLEIYVVQNETLPAVCATWNS